MSDRDEDTAIFGDDDIARGHDSSDGNHTDEEDSKIEVTAPPTPTGAAADSVVPDSTDDDDDSKSTIASPTYPPFVDVDDKIGNSDGDIHTKAGVTTTGPDRQTDDKSGPDVTPGRRPPTRDPSFVPILLLI